jgi:acyl carrier protein
MGAEERPNMDNIHQRLVSCFQAVFPDLASTSIPAASQDSVLAWDSIATITLIGILEDEFAVQFDLERLAEFNSFQAIAAYLRASAV